MKADFYPLDFAVPAYAAQRLYDCAIAQGKEASEESLNHALEALFIHQPDVLAGYLLPVQCHAAVA
jgi:hypothetical protein